MGDNNTDTQLTPDQTAATATAATATAATATAATATVNVSFFNNSLVQTNGIRLAYSYFIFSIIAFMIVKIKTKENITHPHLLLFSFIFGVSTFILEIIWSYFGSNERSDPGKETSTRNSSQEIINNILPISSLVAGYLLLISAFTNSNSDSFGIESVIIIIVGIVFILSYGYLSYGLINILILDDKVKPALNGLFDDEEEDKKATKYDLLLDLLYNLYQPLGVFVISVVLYYIIKLTTSSNQMVYPVAAPLPIQPS